MKNLPLLLICLCFLGCSKDEATTTSKTTLLTTSAWMYNNGGVADANGNILLDFSSLNIIQPCSLDNTIIFSTDSTGTVNENTLVCPNASPVTPFTWNFMNNETTLSISAQALLGLSGQFKIRELSTSKLSLVKDTTVTGYGNVSLLVNLKHP